jgi:glycosyltransferase involved in cell wall biosynthesis
MEHAGQILTLAVSNYLKEQMARSGSSTGYLHTLHSPAPTVEHRLQPPPPDTTPRFLFMGRVIPEKGVGWLLRSLSHVNTAVQIDIAGEGETDSYRQMASRLGVQSQITFHGWKESEELSALIQAARAVVFPSVWNEPAGLVTLEAAAHGRPVIAGEVGGIPEYALDSFAYCVPPHDEHGLARRIDELAQDRDLAIAMGERGYQCARVHFNMDQFIDRLHMYYERAMNDRPTVSCS